ncbi:MAG: aspartate racemase [Flavobacterium sp.]|nr:aspartate racemase [Flavobacterium sp.]
MKTIGLVGGTGWISSAEYYKIINEEVNRRLGGLEFAKCILYSINYAEIDSFNLQNNPEGVYSLIHDASVKLINSGADCILLCANTLHQFADKLQTEIDTPIIHIASVTAKEIKRNKYKKIGLLGTKQTMEMDFYKIRLMEESIETIVPELKDRDYIQNVISNELLKGIFLDESRTRFVEIINGLNNRGAQGIILGCTEIPLLVSGENTNIPLFNTLIIHSYAAVDFALSGS